MENKSSALQTVTRHLVASYREFFDLAAPTAKMPSHQLDLSLIRPCIASIKWRCSLIKIGHHLSVALLGHWVRNGIWSKHTIVTSIGSSPKRRYPTLNDLNDRCWPVAQCRALPSCHSSQAVDHRIRILGLA